MLPVDRGKRRENGENRRKHLVTVDLLDGVDCGRMVVTAPDPQGEAVIKYPAIVTPAEEGGYLVDFPDFEGGAFTEGDTLEEALSNAADVLSLVLEVRKERGEPIPDPGYVAGPNVYGVAPKGES